MLEDIKIHESAISNYVTALVNSRMKHMQDSLEQLKSQQKDEFFYENAFLSIKAVIEHFEILEEAFEDFSIKKLTDWGNNNDHLRWNLGNHNQSKNTTPAYIHYFDVYNVKTSYIINPFSEIFKKYNKNSTCKIILYPTGCLKFVEFNESIHDGNGKHVSFRYNNLLEIDCITQSFFKNGSIVSQQKSYCESLEMETYFIDLFLRGYCDKKTHEILPEFTIPSAYDFNSDEFNIRLKVAEMMFI